MTGLHWGGEKWAELEAMKKLEAKRIGDFWVKTKIWLADGSQEEHYSELFHKTWQADGSQEEHLFNFEGLPYYFGYRIPNWLNPGCCGTS